MPTDLSDTILAKSDQLDAIDLTHPRTFTIERVALIDSDQPVNIHLKEFPRVWRPSRNMRRVLVALWGKDGDAYAGRRITLYNDESVTFGKEKTGGVRISHMSHIPGPSDPAIMITRGKYGTHHVEPLAEPASRPAPTADDVAACSDVDTLRAMWPAASPEVRDLISARKADLETADQPLIPGASS